MSRNRIYAIAFAVFGLLLVLAPRFILPVCEYHGKQVMNCSHTAHYEMTLGAFVMLCAGLLAFLNAPLAKWLFPAIFLLAGAAAMVIPEAVGYCRNPEMPCNYGTVPALRLIGGALSITAIVSFFSLRKPDSGK
ncbi:MAG: DUF4418 family protein [Nitrospirae bacterium]|nr:DUF4418 family protein [Nitrospirota bacterium]